MILDEEKEQKLEETPSRKAFPLEEDGLWGFHGLLAGPSADMPSPRANPNCHLDRVCIFVMI